MAVPEVRSAVWVARPEAPASQMGVCAPPIGDEDVCTCGGTCVCTSDCWCYASHHAGGSSSGGTGATSGATTGSSTGTSGSTTGTTDSTTGSTTGMTSGSTSGTSTGSSTGTTGDDPGTEAGGVTAGGTDAGDTGTSTGGDAPNPTTGGDGWDASDSGIKVEGILENGYVSGTNVNVAMKLSVKQGSPPPSTYTQAYLVGFMLRIGGEDDSAVTVKNSVGQDVTEIPVPGQSSSSSPTDYLAKVRFGSTRFNDNATIAINGRAHWKISTTTGAQQKDLWVDLPTFHVVAYNKGLTLATKLVASCSSSEYTKVESPVAPNYNYDSQQAIPSTSGQEAEDRLSLKAGQMRHAPLGPTAGRSFLTKPQTLAALGQMTAFFAYTHGEPNSFLPSVGSNADGSTYPGDRLVYGTGARSEVGVATVWGDPMTGQGARATQTKPLPPPNMVVLHACSGLSSGTNPFLIAFGLMGKNDLANETTPPNSGIDRAGAGFEVVIMSTTKGGRWLSDHAKFVYQKLLKGATIFDAVDLANREPNLRPQQGFCPPNSSIVDAAMKVKGDRSARLMGVYTGDNRTLGPNAKGNLTWTLVLNPAP